MDDLNKKQKKSTQLNDGDRKVLSIYASHYPVRIELVQNTEQSNTLNSNVIKTDMYY